MTRFLHTYCAETSGQHGESLVATASLVDLWLLIECPGPWASDALQGTEHLDGAVKAHLDALADAMPGLRIQLIQRAEPTGPARTLFVALPDEAAPALYRVPIGGYAELAGLDLAPFARRDPSVEALRTDRRVALVCTHGRHDACCARYGAALYHALEAHPGVEVWQSTHVGGDRFAANLVCLPDGLYFGRVDADAGRAILDDYGAGRVSAGCYRGRCVYERFEQAAECFVRREAPLAGTRDLRLVSSEGDRAARVVTFAGPDGGLHAATVRRVKDGRTAHLTCSSTRPEPLFAFVLDAYRRDR